MPPARSRTPAATSERLNQYRGERRPLPLGDKRVLAVLIPHLCFLPWALGTMHPWSQVTSLVLATLGFAVALSAPSSQKPETGDLRPEDFQRLPAGSQGRYEQPPIRGGAAGSQKDQNFQVSGLRSQVSRLCRFPPFWLGLALLAYIAIQALNPSWRYVTNGPSWWLVHVPNLPWLPTSVDAPFDRFNVWRQFIIYASAWLTFCTVAIGLTRRRSFGVLLTALAINGLVLVLAGFSLRLTQPADHLLWLGRRIGTVTFASFIYKNHAGSYLALIATALLVLAARYRERSLREHAQSSPALLPVLGALVVFFAVVFTYSRGATLLLGAYLVAAATAFALHRYFTRSNSGTPRVVTFTVTAMVLFVVVFAFAQLDFRRSLARFEQLTDPEKKDLSMNSRIEANAASRDMLWDRWPRGVGAGGFRHLFPQYIRRFESSYRGGRFFWEHAHNDWLEISIELGAIGVAILVTGITWWLWRLGRSGVWRRLPPLLLTLGLLQTFGHAAIDFPFQNPAILITWLVLAVIAARYTAPDGVKG